MKPLIISARKAISAEQRAAAFNAYIDGDKYLRSRRGQFAERNAGRIAVECQADLHFAQNIIFGGKQFITFSIDVAESNAPDQQQLGHGIFLSQYI